MSTSIEGGSVGVRAIRLIKRQKRLVVVDSETGQDIYTPPDFVVSRIRSRTDFDQLLAEIAAGRREIVAIMDFESRIRKRMPGGLWN